MTVWLNGALAPKASVPADDRGLLLSDGLFETLLVIDGVPAFFAAHMARMRAGAAALDLEVPYTDGQVLSAIFGLHAANGAPKRASTRITLTRGSGPRGLLPPARAEQAPNLLVTLSPSAAAAQARPTTLAPARTRRNEGSPASRMKTLGYLDNVLARLEASKSGADDALMLNNTGRVACASAANIFVLTENGVATPPEEEGVLPGVVRGVVLSCARSLGLEAAVRPVSLLEAQGAPLILTNSLVGLAPASLGERARSDSRVAALQAAYRARLKADIGSVRLPPTDS